jgi:hypothetical protein
VTGKEGWKPLKIRDQANQKQRAGADRRAGSESEEGLEADFHGKEYHETYLMSNNNFIGSIRTIEHSD